MFLLQNSDSYNLEQAAYNDNPYVKVYLENPYSDIQSSVKFHYNGGDKLILYSQHCILPAKEHSFPQECKVYF